MQIDTAKTDKENLQSIYQHTINSLDIDFEFKPDSEFDRWYSAEDELVMFPHPSVNDPDTAVSSSRYPNIFVSCKDGKIGFGIAFWSTASVDLHLMNILAGKNKKNRNWVLNTLKGLSPDWDWKCSISRKRQLSSKDTVFKKNCVDIDESGLQGIVEKLTKLRSKCQEEAEENGTPCVIPAVNLLTAVVAPDDYDAPVKTAFEIFSEFNTSIAAPAIQKEWNIKKTEIEKFIETLESRLETSKYAEAIQLRIEEQKQKLIALAQDYASS